MPRKTHAKDGGMNNITICCCLLIRQYSQLLKCRHEFHKKYIDLCPAESYHQVIPPGMDFSYVTTQDSMEGEGDLKSLIGSDRAQSKMNLPPIWSEV